MIILAVYYSLCDIVLISQGTLPRLLYPTPADPTSNAVFYYRRKRTLHPSLFTPTTARESDPLLSSFSASDPAHPLNTKMRHWRDLVSYVGGVCMVAGVGIVAWRLSRDVPEGRKQEVWDTKAQIVGWMSAFLYRAFLPPSRAGVWGGGADVCAVCSGIPRAPDHQEHGDQVPRSLAPHVCLLRRRQHDLRRCTLRPLPPLHSFSPLASCSPSSSNPSHLSTSSSTLRGSSVRAEPSSWTLSSLARSVPSLSLGLRTNLTRVCSSGGTRVRGRKAARSLRMRRRRRMRIRSRRWWVYRTVAVFASRTRSTWRFEVGWLRGALSLVAKSLGQERGSQRGRHRSCWRID